MLCLLNKSWKSLIKNNSLTEILQNGVAENFSTCPWAYSTERVLQSNDFFIVKLGDFPEFFLLF